MTTQRQLLIKFLSSLAQYLWELVYIYILGQ